MTTIHGCTRPGLAGGFMRNHHCTTFVLSSYLVAALCRCLDDA